MAIINVTGNGGTQVDITVPATKTHAITNILVCNVSSVNTGAFDLHFVPSGNARGDANKVIHNLSLPPEETFTFDTERIILDAGDYISFIAPNDLVMTLSYMEV